MERKATSGSIRNTERSKKKFLNAVGKILKTKGYSALKINDIAATAGVDKKMIYSYFGGIDGLLDEYLSSKDFWSNISEEDASYEINDGGRKFVEEMLSFQFDYSLKNKEFKQILLWRLSQERKALKKLTDKQEQNGEILFKSITDPHFKEKSEQFRTIMAIMIAGLYHLNMHELVNRTTFCGIDINTPEGQNNIKKAISFMVDQTYKSL